MQLLCPAGNLPAPGFKLGIDATSKWPSETTRAWSRPIALDAAVEKRVDALWSQMSYPVST